MSEFSEAIAAMFERNLLAVTLREPDTIEPARAKRIVGLLVETLGGYAFGTVAGQLVRAVATWFGAEQAAIVRALIVEIPSTKREVTFDSISLRAEFARAMRTRLGSTVRQLERLEAAIPTDRARTSAAMFSTLKRESVFEDRLSLEIQTGWTYACGVIERAPVDLRDIPPRARTLWTNWHQLAGGVAIKPARQPAQMSGYIALVG